MPVHPNLPKEGMIYQREQYAKGGPGRWYWDLRDSIAFSYIEQEHHTILDMGCGEGIGLEKLKKQFPQKMVLGIDLEKENVEICKSHQLDVIRSNVYDLPLKNESIDLCICIDMLEHLKEPLNGLKELRRILKKDGLLIMTIPNDRNFFLARIAMFMFKEAFYDSGHEKKWTPKSITRLIWDAGLKIQEKKNLPFIFWQISLHHLIVVKKV
ncbi:MAG TPA: class I SAM-dependent methyltransferase [Syntrophorhabdaceae bacterium]|nr:class I SAM-dependent methyltransferase [Syntrophorhabdaceae bacterium]